MRPWVQLLMYVPFAILIAYQARTIQGLRRMFNELLTSFKVVVALNSQIVDQREQMRRERDEAHDLRRRAEEKVYGR